MVGTLFGLPLSQRVDVNGNPLSGWLLYIYDALTSTPSLVYSDTALGTTISNPVEADSFGMLPVFWLADGTYRARATTSDGSETIYDIDSILAIGPSSGTGGGGGSGVSADQVFAVGDTMWLPSTAVRTGFVKLIGTSIGSATSGATQRANADTSSLYAYCWNAFSNAICPVSGGRGASPTADFSANKTLTLLNMPTSSVPAGFQNGTWTPTLTFGGATTGITYSTQVGHYIRVGDTVTAWGSIVLTLNGSATGTATVTGLPFAAVTLTGAKFGGTFTNYGNVTSAATSFFCSVGSGASVLDLSKYLTDSSGAMDESNFDDDAFFSLFVQYQTAQTDIGTPGTWYQKL